MTWKELVKEYFPNANDEFCDFVLWEKTPFPCSQDKEEIRRFIKEFKESSHE